MMVSRDGERLLQHAMGLSWDVDEVRASPKFIYESCHGHSGCRKKQEGTQSRCETLARHKYAPNETVENPVIYTAISMATGMCHRVEFGGFRFGKEACRIQKYVHSLIGTAHLLYMQHKHIAYIMQASPDYYSQHFTDKA